MNNSQAGVPSWMMILACLLMAAIVSGVIDQTPTSGRPLSNVIAE